MTFFPETSMAAVFQNRVQKYKDQALVAYKKDGRYTDISWNSMNAMVRELAGFLLSKGIKKGDTIAIFSTNRYEWWVTDLAALSVNAVDVPIYPTNSSREAQYILENSDACMCFVGTKDQMNKVLEAKKSLPNLKDIIVFDGLTEEVSGVMSFTAALEAGKASRDDAQLEKRIREIRPEDPATIIYTSGTTGNPKGVLLSHLNILVNTLQSTDVGGRFWFLDFEFLSFLPLSHGYERIAAYYMSIHQGRKTYFAESFAKIVDNLREVKPGFIISVPRLFEKLHAGVLSKVSEAPPKQQKLFNWALGVARKNIPYICHDKPRKGLFALEYALADRIVLSKLKKALGLDKLKIAISGGGALAVSDIEFFLGLDIRVLEGFGITECSPCTNCNRPELIKPGTCGPADLYTEEKIAEDGELLIRGPQVMLGYYKDPEATRQAFTEDGFLKTGDIAEFDKDGHLKITGRKKEIIVTAGGKNIAPLNIETSLAASRYIEQVAIIGEKRKYLSALIVPNFPELEAWAKKNGVDGSDRAALIRNEAVSRLFTEEVARCTKDLGQVEQVKKFTLLPAEWSQDTGELTPTLKVKRKVIDKKYASQIEAMYPPE
ncbi:MAG TPA: long-chain fatty acid--CoA ligase [Deltaproteobacteria bacterium]|nr:long-chain fatty acid--CoA ligase [Deltaproteobacteria bacterium]HPR55997.1 long-chain fatty acid--CoA ligase [Deltaproteobacteria bacterium]HXK48386.1 long-chain fatty acid--CoA ligase [Deltaproteobacteria bacterium]